MREHLTQYLKQIETARIRFKRNTGYPKRMVSMILRDKKIFTTPDSNAGMSPED